MFCRFDRLYKEGKTKVEKKNMLPKDEMAALKRKIEQEELRECTFKPKTTWKKVFGAGAFEDDDSYDAGMNSRHGGWRVTGRRHTQDASYPLRLDPPPVAVVGRGCRPKNNALLDLRSFRPAAQIGF